MSHREAVLANQAHLDPRVRTVPGTPSRAGVVHLRPAHRARPRQGRAEHLPRRRGRRLHRDGVRAREALRRRRRARARQRRDPSAPRASGAHRLADRPPQPQRLLRAAAPVAAGVEPHAHAGRGAHARHRRLQARQRRPRPRRRRRASALPRRRCCARASGRRTSICRLGGEEFAVVMVGCDEARTRVNVAERVRAGSPSRVPRCRPAGRLRRARARARARDEPARAGGVRRGGDDDREGAGQEPHRPLLRRRDRASRRAGGGPRRALDRAPEDAPEPQRQAQPHQRRPRDRRGDRGRAPVAHRLPQLPRLRRRRRRISSRRLPRRPLDERQVSVARPPPDQGRRGNHRPLRRARRVDRRRRRRELRVRAPDRGDAADRGVAPRGAASLRLAASSA